MNILYFGSFSKSYDTELYIADGLKRLGHNVVCEQNCSLLNIKEHLKNKPDFILFSKVKLSKESRNEIIKSGILTVSWCFDLFFKTQRQSSMKDYFLFDCDLVFSTNGGNEKEYKELGIKKFTLRQGIYDKESKIEKPSEEYRCDIAFIGGTSAHNTILNWRYRSELINFLKNTYGIRFRHFGNDETKQIRNLELNKLLASVKIMIGDSVYSPYYWSNRLYEIIGRGGFCIFPMIDGLDKEFIPYKHFVPYHFGDFSGLKKKIDYYLWHNKEREKIKIDGFNYCKKNHTYFNRCKDLIKIINENRNYRKSR